LDEITNFNLDEIQCDEKINFILEKRQNFDLNLLKLPESLISQNKPSEEFFMCKLCKNILIEPKECFECEDLFCSSCIKKKIEKQDECPFCRESPFKEAKFNKQLYYILNQMIIKCPFYCEEIFMYEDLSKHLKSCQNIPKVYKCKLCDMKIKIENPDNDNFLLTEHNKSCTGLLKKCIHCNNEFQKMHLQSHMKHCEYKLFFCSICKMKFPGKFRLAHNDFYCRQITELHKIFEKIMQNIYI